MPVYEECKLEFITRASHAKRCVVLLISNNKKITAEQAFKKFTTTVERQFRVRFDGWIEGHNKPKWYHGWNKSEFRGAYTKCYVFKYDKHRLYGFLCNPKKSDTRFQACILVSYATKTEHETDEVELIIAEEQRMNILVQKTIEKYFGEKNGSALDRKKH